jgi:hypothetical protein
MKESLYVNVMSVIQDSINISQLVNQMSLTDTKRYSFSGSVIQEPVHANFLPFKQKIYAVRTLHNHQTEPEKTEYNDSHCIIA